MPMAVPMRDDYSGDDLRRLASTARDGWQARRLMALAAVADGKNRTEAAAVGLMDRQTLRDWVIRFNSGGPDSLINKKTPGRGSKFTVKQKSELAQIVEEGPANHAPDLIRWRRIDLVRIVKKRFDVECHISPRPQHPKQDIQVIEEYKKTSRPSWQKR